MGMQQSGHAAGARIFERWVRVNGGQPLSTQCWEHPWLCWYARQRESATSSSWARATDGHLDPNLMKQGCIFNAEECI